MKKISAFVRALRARDYLDLGLGLVAVLGIFLALLPLFTPPEPVQFVLAIALSVMAIGFFIVAFALYVRSNLIENEAASGARWSRHLNALSTAVLMAANAGVYRQVDEVAEDFPARATDVCREFAATFREVVHRDVRVTLKQIYVPAEEEAKGITRQAVRTMVAVGSREAARDDVVDWVDENSDFDGIINHAKTHFFSNDLIAELQAGYRNSHWTSEKLQQWAVDGKYPYRSTFVWPVRAQIDPAGEKQRWSTVGFLCVDCTESKVFDPKLDLEIGEIVAQALYGVWPARTFEKPTSEGAP